MLYSIIDCVQCFKISYYIIFYNDITFPLFSDKLVFAVFIPERVDSDQYPVCLIWADDSHPSLTRDSRKTSYQAEVPHATIRSHIYKHTDCRLWSVDTVWAAAMC